MCNEQFKEVLGKLDLLLTSIWELEDKVNDALAVRSTGHVCLKEIKSKVNLLTNKLDKLTTQAINLRNNTRI